MNRSPAHRPDIEELVDAYRADLRGGRDVRRTPGDLGGAHVLHPGRRGGLVCVAAGSRSAHCR